MHAFSPASAIRFGWATFRKRPWIFVGATLAVALASMIGNIAAGAFGDRGAAGLLGALITSVVSILIGMGQTAFFLKAERDVLSPAIPDLWHPQPFWKYAGAVVLVGISMLIAVAIVLLLALALNLATRGGGGTVLNVVTATLLVAAAASIAIRLQFAQYFVIDRGSWPLEALRGSLSITRGNFWRLVGFLLLVLLINVLGVIALAVGLLVSIPVTMLAVVHAYRTLSGTHESRRADSWAQ